MIVVSLKVEIHPLWKTWEKMRPKCKILKPENLPIFQFPMQTMNAKADGTKPFIFWANFSNLN
jgi:hypothetical protein